MEKKVSVSAIRDGTVIDHITQGSALIIIRLLKLPRDQNRVTVGLNLSSRSMGFKDLIKIENCFLTEKEANDIAVFAPEATLSIIRDYKVQQKMKARLPDVLENILVCANPCCITRKEPVNTLFYVEEFKQKIFLRCGFCEKLFERSEIRDYKT
ncbi:MAG: aspartate carbamoyltransferase regulatory subunit [Chlamydiales bacterium]|nr:aspartate carbamoyltransferase regulatory subunit [Chlamydiales bacterium]